MRVQGRGAYAKQALAALFDRHPLAARDRALVSDLVYGTLRHEGHLDACLQPLLRRPLGELPLPVVVALRLGAYQILLARAPSHSAVDQSVGLVAGRYGRLRGLVNAVLRQLVRRAEGLAAGTAAPQLPAWLLADVAGQRGPGAAAAWAASQSTRADLEIRINPLRWDRAAAEQALAAVTRTARCPAPFDLSLRLQPAGAVADLPGFAAGRFSVQDVAATAVGLLAELGPGQVAVDLCAAPGGKATHLAERMGDRGQILALERHPGRAKLVAAGAGRLGLHSVQTRTGDSTDAAWLAAQVAEVTATGADCALVDAPCSGLGTLRRHPDRLARLGRGELGPTDAPLALQAALLDAGAAVVAVGGQLIYAVCTPCWAEGPGQVAAFLRRHPGWAAEPVPAPLHRFAAAGGPGLQTWTDRDGCDSFFAAALRRQAPP